MNGDLLTDRSVGCLAGAAVGDALGGATEGWESHEIHAHFDGWVTGIVESIRRTLKVEKAFSPFHKGDGHVTDDTLMTRVLVHAYDVKRDHLDAYDVESLMLPEIVDKPMWVPELGREDLLYHRLFLAEKWLVLKLRYGHADPRDAGVGNIVNCGAAMYIAPVGIANAGDPQGAYNEAIDLSGAHQSSYGREAAGVLAAAVAEALRLGATVDDVVETALRFAKDATRTSIEAVVETAAKLDGWRSGGLAGAAQRVCAVRLGRRALRPAGAERPDSEPAACDRGAAPRPRDARRDRRQLRGDGPRRRQLRARLGLDRLDGRRARRRTRRHRRAAARLGRRRLGGKPDRRRGGGPDNGRRGGRDLRARHAATRAASADDRRAHRRRGACLSLRVTWVQPEDLIGHELRQAREEGKEVDEVEQRWFAAGGAPAPGRGASQEPVPDELRALALELLDELESIPRPLAAEEPDDFDEILAAAEPASAAPPLDLPERIAGAWLGRAAGCVLGKPVENIPREGIRAIAEATGNWPVAGWFTAEGLPEEVSERWPWNRASRPTSLAENIDGIPEDDDLNFTMLGVALLERCGTEFDALDVAKIWLDYLPSGRIFTAERVAMRNLLEAYLPPQTATRRNPFREWIGARLRVDAYGWAAPGDPVAAARLAWEDARVSHTANGVYAAMFMAAAHAASLSESSATACADIGLSVVPAQSRLAESLRTARDLAGEHPWEEVVDALYARYGHYHWVHAINNTALTAAALYAFDGDFSGGICAVVQGGLDTDTNGAAVGSILGALAGVGGIEERWSAPLGGRFESSLPGFDGIGIDELVQRTLAVAPS